MSSECATRCLHVAGEGDAAAEQPARAPAHVRHERAALAGHPARLPRSKRLARQDLMKIDPDRARDVRVTLVEAMQVLGSFDARLREYAARTLHRQGIHLVHGMVKEVREKEVELRSGDVMPYGLCVWSTGVGAPPLRTIRFLRSCSLSHCPPSPFKTSGSRASGIW